MKTLQSAETKLDLKKELKSLYSGKVGSVSRLVCATHRFLCCDGAGDPNTSEHYRRAVEALFSVSYALKFGARKQHGHDYVVMPLEGLWWSEDLSAFRREDRNRWRWTMMIMQPRFIAEADLAAAQAVAAKRGVAAELVRLEELKEGTAAQTLHVGPFRTEGATIERLHTWITSAGHTLAGKHHEIYLTDIRRVPPERWKTLIRQPYVEA